jgi:hypothetical protein
MTDIFSCSNIFPSSNDIIKSSSLWHSTENTMTCKWSGNRKTSEPLLHDTIWQWMLDIKTVTVLVNWSSRDVFWDHWHAIEDCTENKIKRQDWRLTNISKNTFNVYPGYFQPYARTRIRHWKREASVHIELGMEKAKRPNPCYCWWWQSNR